MALPVFERFCGLNLRTATFLFTLISLGCCILNITSEVIFLQEHEEGAPVVNIILTGIVMFNACSAMCNVTIQIAIIFKCSQWLEWARLFDSMFMLVGIMTSMFNPDVVSFKITPGHIISLFSIMMFGIVYSALAQLVLNSYIEQLKKAPRNVANNDVNNGEEMRAVTTSTGEQIPE